MRRQAVMFGGQRGLFAALLATSAILGTSACNAQSSSPPPSASGTPIIATSVSSPTRTLTPARPSVQEELATVLRELGLPPKGGVTPLQSVETIGIGVAYPSGKKVRYPQFPAKGIAAHRTGATARVQMSYGIGRVAVLVTSLEQPLPAKLDYCDADWTRAPSFIDGTDLCSVERISPTAVVQTIDYGNLLEMRLILPRRIITVNSGAEDLKTPGAKPALSKVAQRKLLLDPRWR